MIGNKVVDEILNIEAMQDCIARRHFWIGTIPPSRLKCVFSWQQLNQVLTCARITNDRLRLSTEHDHQTPNKSVFRPVKDSFGRSTDAFSISAFHAQLELGATGVLEAVNELHPYVREMTEAVSQRLYARVSANAYFSFGKTSGFGVHNDDHDVIVLQIEGRKRWQFWEGKGDKCKATVLDCESPPSTLATEEILLGEGDVLYIPKGTWHDVIAVGEPSLHITVSVVHPCVKEYIEWLMSKNRFQAPYRDIRLSTHEFEDAACATKALFNAAVSPESVAEFVGLHHTRYSGFTVRPTLPQLNNASENDEFKMVSFHVIDIERDRSEDHRQEHFRIFALGAVHTVSATGRRVLDTLMHCKVASGQVIVDTLRRDDISSEQTLQALKNLLEQGLISKTGTSCV
ncbi:JmjC domain-containing protein [Pandoraea sp. NPDC090278]|uniref:JmjC domain-containing protein n=1 Tax=Pandoraea sp. NPDC090278 TaxID=3364391 RepID=UPI003839F1A0